MKFLKNNRQLTFVILFSLVLLIILIIATYLSLRNSKTDVSLLTLTDTEVISPAVNPSTISFKFHSNYPRIGTIRIEFAQLKKDQNIGFEIKDVQTNTLINSSNHTSSKFGKDFYYPFGFPVIINRPPHDYLVTISDPQQSLKLIDRTIKIQHNLKPIDLINPQISVKLLLNRLNEFLTLYRLSDFLTSIILCFSFPLLYLLLFSLPPTTKRVYRTISSTSHPVHLTLNYSPKIKKFLKYFLPLLIFTVTFIVTYNFARIAADPHHDGITYKPALDVARGLILFRDTFTQYGALTVFIQALAIKIGGEHLLAIKMTTVITYSFIALIMWFVNRKFLPQLLALATFFLWLIMAPYYETTFLAWSSVYCIFWQLIAVVILFSYIKRNTLLKLFLLGLICALCLWTKQSVGGVLFLTSLFSILLLSIYHHDRLLLILTKLSAVISGFCLISLLFFVWLFLNHALSDWWLQSIINSKNWIGTNNTLENILKALMVGSYSTISFWAFVPLTSILVAIQIFHKKIKTPKDLSILVLIITGIGSWHQYYPVSDIRHTYWASSIMFGTSVYCLYLIYKNLILKHSYRWSVVATILTFIILFRNDLNTKIGSFDHTLNQLFSEINEPEMFRGLKIHGGQAIFITRLYEDINRIKKHYPNIALITIGPDALYLGMDPVSHNAHPMFIDWAGFNRAIYPNFDQQMDQYIKINQPLIIYTHNPFDPHKKIPPGYCPRDYQDYQSNYLLVPCNMIKFL